MGSPGSAPDKATEALHPTAAGGRCVVTFIVPALNEADNLPGLAVRLLAVGRTLACSHEIVVVDDDSTDATAEVTRQLAAIHPEIRLLRKKAPRGLGRAVRLGIENARGRLGIVIMADGVDPLESAVPRFVDEILRNGCQLVLLSRYNESGNAASIPWSYRTLHWLFRLITRFLLGIPYSDTTYAFRAFDLSFVRKLGLKSNGFEISPEVTFKTILGRGKVGQVQGRQTRRKMGKSKFSFLRVCPGYGRVVLEMFAHRLGFLALPRERPGQASPQPGRDLEL